MIALSNTMDTSLKTFPAVGSSLSFNSNLQMERNDLSFPKNFSHKKKRCWRCALNYGGFIYMTTCLFVLVVSTNIIPSVIADPKVKVSKVLVSTTTGKTNFQLLYLTFCIGLKGIISLFSVLYF